MTSLLARIAGIAGSLFVLSVLGCSAQGEGERCDQNNGNADCASGLQCSAIPSTNDYRVCCPPDGVVSSNPLCNGSQQSSFDAGAPPVVAPDASTAEGSANDAPGTDEATADGATD
ncbi:MAG TPA: hypothetical protein VJT73_10830 [Polyangiaceae bacterium]|nr:hypothetical protein [Polyangiaceae bacterium]